MMVAQPDADPPRFTVIVPSDRPDVREELAQELSGEGVEVVFERRREDRRPPSHALAADDHQMSLPMGAAGASVMYIVSREAPEQFQFVLRHFVDESDIRVLYDRRHGDRRGALAAHPTGRGERRQTDRRRIDTEQDLRAVGWTSVRIEATA